MTSNPSSSPRALEQLQAIRPLMLRLHKSLMEREKISYEEKFGPITSRGEYFQLVVGHEWFSWLHAISQMIVQIDETLAAKEPLPNEVPIGVVNEIRQLMNPAEDGTLLERRYHYAIHRDAEIALMHAQLLHELQG